MRVLALGILLATPVVLADPKAPRPKPAPATAQSQIEALVRQNVDAMPGHAREAKALGVADDAVVYLERGIHPEITADRKLGDNFYADEQSTIHHDLGKVLVAVDEPHGSGWFQATYTITFTPPAEMGTPTKLTRRLGGIALRDPKGGWLIPALAYTNLLSDHDLVTKTPRFRSTDVPKGPPKLVGDAALAKLVAGWFGSGFSAHAAANATLIATGSSPGETQTGASVASLVKSWDALGIVPRELEATIVPGAKLGFVHADVAMPIKKQNRTAPLQVYIVVVPDGTDWKWVSIQYGGEWSLMD